jgi:hypothetical protein
MKGPGSRIDLDVRRVWECPSCGRRARTGAVVVSKRCDCTETGVWMRLVAEPRPPRGLSAPFLQPEGLESPAREPSGDSAGPEATTHSIEQGRVPAESAEEPPEVRSA